MQPNNSIGAPFDPDPDSQLPDDQTTLKDDYLDNAVADVPQGMLDNPEDIPIEEKDQLREAVLDDMPGADTEDAERRIQESPNELKNSRDDQSQYDSDRNPDPDHANWSRTIDDSRDEDDEPEDITRVA